MKRVLRVVGLATGAGLALWGALVASDKVLFHGFGEMCADGNPEFDPRICGITWVHGLPYVLVGLAGLTLLAVSASNPLFARLLFGAAGLFGMVLALFLLWSTTWVPINPRFPEPAWPQLVLLCVSGAVVVGAVQFGKRRRTESTRST